MNIIYINIFWYISFACTVYFKTFDIGVINKEELKIHRFMKSRLMVYMF